MPLPLTSSAPPLISRRMQADAAILEDLDDVETITGGAEHAIQFVRDHGVALPQQLAQKTALRAFVQRYATRDTGLGDHLIDDPVVHPGPGVQMLGLHRERLAVFNLFSSVLTLT